MATNKERIKNLEAALGGFQNHLSKFEESVTAKLQQLEITLSKTTEALLSKQQPFSSHRTSFTVRSHNTKEESRDLITQKRNLGKDEGKKVTWEIFVKELWARFGPTDCEDFDEALSKIKQTGSLCDYQKEFERLGNRVHGWTQKALVGIFMGGLKVDIADGIRMFTPKSLKKAISLAEKIGKVAYELKLPDGSRVHPIFHVSLLKKYIGDNNISSTELPTIADYGEIVVKPEAIFNTRWVKKGKSIIEESLVQWKKLPIEDATWENTQELWNMFPNLNLKEKVPLLEESNDKPRRTTMVSIRNPKYMD
ncbi:hypothetical protein JRO89_XS06G0001100 [Xanthoceras sorbifolium]|uniref:Retrotransposon gag domain-containing protein n=1 Tax=Xanthoceras sorbifolium TaxID=99658 RepID=A0ABQ8HVQ6_9ROSI|nr:hypothetical protein JRO89_XS06G0001100 [Xanthoceras sorbifolium]